MNAFKSIFVNMLLWVLTCVALGASVYCFYVVFTTDSESQSTLYTVLATLLLIASITLLQFACADIYNGMNDLVKTASNAKGVTLEQIFEAFKDLETALGKPWMGKVKSISGQVILFGPSPDGEFIYVRTFGKGRVSIALNDMPSFIHPGKEDAWRLEEAQAPDRLDDFVRYRFGSACILPELTERVQEFLNTGTADLTPIGMGRTEDIYLVTEEFTWNGQDFHLVDTDGNEALRISAPIPCKTFHISEAPGDRELFMLTKRVFHIMPTYDLFENGQKIGRMKKRLIFHHKHFVADTSRGRLEMRNMNATFGSNYQVRLDGQQIGTVARKLNIELDNIVFDNFILSVSAPEYLPLMAGMCVMAAREAQRDKVEEVVDLADD